MTVPSADARATRAPRRVPDVVTLVALSEIVASEVGRAAVWTTVAMLVLVGVIGVVAAFADRRRGREIERDRSRFPGTGHSPYDRG